MGDQPKRESAKRMRSTVGFVLWQHLLGAPCFRTGFCSKTIIPDSEEHPLASSRAVPKDVLRWIRAYTRTRTRCSARRGSISWPYPLMGKARADLTVLAVEAGAKGIMTREAHCVHPRGGGPHEVEACADAGVPLVCGAISTNHPSFGKAKELVTSGAIGDVTSIEAESDQNLSQHQNPTSSIALQRGRWASATRPSASRAAGEYRGSGYE